MEKIYLPLILGAGLLLFFGLTSVLFYRAHRMGRLSLRLIALVVFLAISAISALCWFYIGDKTLTLIMLGLGSFAGLSVLSWKFTNPKLVKLLNLKW